MLSKRVAVCCCRPQCQVKQHYEGATSEVKTAEYFVQSYLCVLIQRNVIEKLQKQLHCSFIKQLSSGF